MTLIHADGFDTLVTEDEIDRRYTTYNGFGAADLGSGRISGNALKINSSAYVDVNLPHLISSGSYVYFGFAMKADTLFSGYSQRMIEFWNTSGYQFYITMGAAPAIYRATTLIQTGEPYFTTKNWHHVEVKATVANSTSAGDVIIRIDGREALNIDAGKDIQTQTSGDITAIRFFGGNLGAQAIYIDDLWICDEDGTTNNTFLGDVRVTPIYPNGVGSNSNFTPSDATSDNYEMVNDATNDGDATYVESQTVGHIDSYQHETISSAAEIKGVAVWGSMNKTNAGDRTLKAVAASQDGSSGTLGVSPQTIYPTAGQYNDEFGIFEEDPNTGTAWTESGVNAAEFGFKIES